MNNNINISKDIKDIKDIRENKDINDTKDMSDIDKYIEKHIEIKLNNLLETLPNTVPKDLNIKPIYNLTIKELYKNTLQSLIDIINDVIDAYNKKEYINTNNYIFILINIFTKDNRKIYVGIMIVILSFIMYFIDSASM